jgi:hypothetical protein
MAIKNQTLYPLAFVLDQNKLNGTNFIDWYRNSEDYIKARKCMCLMHSYLNHMLMLLLVLSEADMRKGAMSSMR